MGGSGADRGPPRRPVRHCGSDAQAEARRCPMRIVDVVQGTPEWLQARLGIPTASQADRILTPGRLKPAAASREYLYQLLAEWLIGYPIEWSASSQYMQRGTDLEAEARAACELEMGADGQHAGLRGTDDGLFGGRP